MNPAPSLGETPSADPRLQVVEVGINLLDRLRLRGWLVRPPDGALRRSVAVGHGYRGIGALARPGTNAFIAPRFNH